MKKNYALHAILAAAMIAALFAMTSCSRKTCGPPSHTMEWDWIQQQKAAGIYKNQ